MGLLRGLGAVALLAWIYLLFFRARFWRLRDDAACAGAAPTRRIAAVIPARNEAAVIGGTVESLAAQDICGELRVFVVDDHSDDETAARAREAAHRSGISDRFTVLSGRTLPPGWTGKLWAVSQGVEAALQWRPDYLLFTDADIRHAPDNVRSLVSRAEG